jgi:hypothetical protein
MPGDAHEVVQLQVNKAVPCRRAIFAACQPLAAVRPWSPRLPTAWAAPRHPGVGEALQPSASTTLTVSGACGIRRTPRRARSSELLVRRRQGTQYGCRQPTPMLEPRNGRLTQAGLRAVTSSLTPLPGRDAAGLTHLTSRGQPPRHRATAIPPSGCEAPPLTVQKRPTGHLVLVCGAAGSGRGLRDPSPARISGILRIANCPRMRSGTPKWLAQFPGRLERRYSRSPRSRGSFRGDLSSWRRPRRQPTSGWHIHRMEPRCCLGMARLLARRTHDEAQVGEEVR